MRKYFFILSSLLCIFSFNAFSQKVENLLALKQKQPYDNIVSQQINSDSSVTSTLIWIKDVVKPHYHADHSEQVYVIEGNGQMLLGSQSIAVGSGDLIYIPKGMVHALRVIGKDKVMKVLSIQTPQFDGSDRVMVGKEGW
ncbi:MAG: cupin domain-containing protein [Chitinophagales bacterium]|nr:cupin domain-containing protein [Chitinophagales bacterium]